MTELAFLSNEQVTPPGAANQQQSLASLFSTSSTSTSTQTFITHTHTHTHTHIIIIIIIITFDYIYIIIITFDYIYIIIITFDHLILLWYIIWYQSNRWNSQSNEYPKTDEFHQRAVEVVADVVADVVVGSESGRTFSFYDAGGGIEESGVTWRLNPGLTALPPARPPVRPSARPPGLLSAFLGCNRLIYRAPARLRPRLFDWLLRADWHRTLLHCPFFPWQLSRARMDSRLQRHLPAFIFPTHPVAKK